MDILDYQIAALKTAKKLHPEDALINACFGLAGETGEVIDLFKKAFFQGHQLDKDRVTDELGDVLWYLAYMAAHLGINLDVIAKRNIEKLAARYPNGFSADASLKRLEN